MPAGSLHIGQGLKRDRPKRHGLVAAKPDPSKIIPTRGLTRTRILSVLPELSVPKAAPAPIRVSTMNTRTALNLDRDMRKVGQIGEPLLVRTGALGMVRY